LIKLDISSSHIAAEQERDLGQAGTEEPSRKRKRGGKAAGAKEEHGGGQRSSRHRPQVLLEIGCAAFGQFLSSNYSKLVRILTAGGWKNDGRCPLSHITMDQALGLGGIGVRLERGTAAEFMRKFVAAAGIKLTK
jgi:hypothetical protein